MISRAARTALRKSRDAIKALRADTYYLGDEAWHYGQPAKANPFRTDTEEYTDWHKGWFDAEFENTKARLALLKAERRINPVAESQLRSFGNGWKD